VVRETDWMMVDVVSESEVVLVVFQQLLVSGVSMVLNIVWTIVGLLVKLFVAVVEVGVIPVVEIVAVGVVGEFGVMKLTTAKEDPVVLVPTEVAEMILVVVVVVVVVVVLAVVLMLIMVLVVMLATTVPVMGVPVGLRRILATMMVDAVVVMM